MLGHNDREHSAPDRNAPLHRRSLASSAADTPESLTSCLLCCKHGGRSECPKSAFAILVPALSDRYGVQLREFVNSPSNVLQFGYFAAESLLQRGVFCALPGELEAEMIRQVGNFQHFI